MKALFSAIIDDEPLPLENDHNAQTLGNRPTTTAPTTAPKRRRQVLPTRFSANR